MAAKGYKAFAHGMTCLGKQYSENTIFEESGASACCEAGVMHYCENPLDVLNHYPLIDDNGNVVEIAEVEPLAEVLHKDDKCATKKLKIGSKIKITDLVDISRKYLVDTAKVKLKKAIIGADQAKQVAHDDSKQIGGDSVQQVVGWRAIQIGGDCAIQIGGGYAKQIGGGFAQQVSGNCAQQVGGYSAKQIGGNFAKQVSGDFAKQVSGDYAKQIGGYYAKQKTGKNSVIMAGPGSRFKAGLYSVVLYYWYGDDGNIAGFKAAQVDNKKLKADSWYELKGGKFVEVE